jgi:hypothetical protein
MTYICPACGFPNLKEDPRPKTGGGSYEICPSCNFEFGVTDDDLGLTFDQWRAKWIQNGMPWDSGNSSPPKGWDPKSQLTKFLKDGGR